MLCFHSSVWWYVIKYHRKQTSGPRGVNWHANLFCQFLYAYKIDKISLHAANFHANHQHPWPLFSRADSIRVHWEVNTWLPRKQWQSKYCNCQHIGSCMWPFDGHIYIWSWPILKVKVMHMKKCCSQNRPAVCNTSFRRLFAMLHLVKFIDNIKIFCLC